MQRVTTIIQQRANNREIVLYGCSDMCEALHHMLESYGCKVSLFVDRNHSLFHGYGCKVVSPDVISPDKHFVIVVPFGTNAIKSICKNCMRLGYKQEDWFVWSKEVNYDIVYNNVVLGKHFQLCKALIRYDTYSYIQSVGRYSSINHTFGFGSDHSFNLSTSSRFSSPVSEKRHKLEIGHDVWIGANTFINCSKVKKVGNGAVIGTGAVVLEDVPPYAVVAGVPAKIKKFRFTPEQVSVLEKVQWWNWNDRQMEENAECFNDYNLFFQRFR